MTGFLTAISIIILAHSWYNPWCCNGEDCKPVACEELIDNADGSITWKGYTAPKANVYPSQDSKCHFCVYDGTVPPRRCAYIQMNT